MSEGLWEEVRVLLPPEPPKPKGGRPRLSDRAVLEGIIHILATGTPWHSVPASRGRPSGVTCWRRLKEWQRCGAWHKIHPLLFERPKGMAR